MIFHPIKVIDVELSQPISDITGLNKYSELRVLVRLHKEPIGYVSPPVIEGVCAAKDIYKVIFEQHSWRLILHLLRDGLATPQAGNLHITDLIHSPHPTYSGPLPTVTVAVCTRNRTDDLARCLQSLIHVDYPTVDFLVVDNAPTTDATEQLVRTSFPKVRYVCEPRPGLNWARNRAIFEASGEVLAYVDDDAVVDTEWVRSFARIFAERPEVMAVTGLVVPYELETPAQILFEWYGGFGRGFEQQWYCLNRDDNALLTPQHAGAGKFGTGANMAYRRVVFEHLGLFDPALDVGTVTNGGGDLEMFFRVLKAGHTLVYEPNAVVWHRHRYEYAELKTQLTNNGIGFSSYLVRNALVYRDERFALLRFWFWWMRWWLLRRLVDSWKRKSEFPRDLIVAEFYGYFVGLARYMRARRQARTIEQKFGSLSSFVGPSKQGAL